MKTNNQKKTRRMKKSERKKLAVRIACLALAGLMLLGAAYTVLSFFFL